MFFTFTIYFAIIANETCILYISIYPRILFIFLANLEHHKSAVKFFANQTCFSKSRSNVRFWYVMVDCDTNFTDDSRQFLRYVQPCPVVLAVISDRRLEADRKYRHRREKLENNVVTRRSISFSFSVISSPTFYTCFTSTGADMADGDFHDLQFRSSCPTKLGK